MYMQNVRVCVGRFCAKGDVTAEQPIYEITVDYKATYGEADFQGIFHFQIF